MKKSICGLMLIILLISLISQYSCKQADTQIVEKPKMVWQDVYYCGDVDALEQGKIRQLTTYDWKPFIDVVMLYAERRNQWPQRQQVIPG
jgi:hypothetical protein